MQKTRARDLNQHPLDETSSISWCDRNSGGAVALFFASYLLLSSVFGAIVAVSLSVAPDPASLSATQIALLLIASFVAALGSLWLTIKLPARLPITSVGLLRPSRRWTLFGVGLGLLGWVLSGIIGALYAWATGDASVPRPEIETALGSASVLQLALLLIAACLLAPIAEEIIFRGVLYTYLRRWGFVVALIASSLVFGVFHGFGILFFTTSTAGALFALAYERSGSLWPVVAAHATMNAAMFVAGWLLGP